MFHTHEVDTENRLELYLGFLQFIKKNNYERRLQGIDRVEPLDRYKSAASQLLSTMTRQKGDTIISKEMKISNF